MKALSTGSASKTSESWIGSEAFVCILRDICWNRFLTNFFPCSRRIGFSGREADSECASREGKIIIDDPRSALFGWLEMAGIESTLLSSARPYRAENLDRPPSRAFACSPKATSFRPADDPPLVPYPFRDLNHP